MSISYKKTVAHLAGACAVEEAEELWTWLQNHPQGKVNLKACEHLHCAVLQVLMKSQPKVSAMPVKKDLTTWLQPALAA